MKKRVLGIILLLALVLTFMPTSASAKNVEIVPYDYYHNGGYWPLYSDYYVKIYDAADDYVGTVYYGDTILNLTKGSYTAKVYYGNNRYYTEDFYYNGTDSVVRLSYYGYYDGYYPYDRYISSVRVYGNKVTGVTAPYAKVVLYNSSGKIAETDVADAYGNFSISYNFEKYYYDEFYGRWYNIDDFYLRADNGAKYYLNSGYVDGYYYYNSGRVNNPKGGDDFINGKWAYPYALVTVRDNQDRYLGSATAASDGSFSIALSRDLIAGETLRITYGHRNYVDRTETVIVGGIRNPEKREKVVSKFVIGDPEYSETKYGKTKQEKMDVAPYIKNGRTMLPLRYVAQSLGYKVNWDQATKNAVFIKGSNVAVINLYSREIFVNRKSYTLSVEPVTVEGRIMLPVSELGMALGLTHGNYGQDKNIEWDASTQSVIITTYQ
ncbi:MAG: stalk domain-containing protein [Bacillota bacterium]|nr:stalk domain-containing protein [Bacillota bacterium]